MRDWIAQAFTITVVLAVLAGTGRVAGRWVDPAWRAVRASEPALQAQSLQQTAGHGLAFGLLGGFRAVIADLLWVRMNAHWETSDLPGTQQLIELATTVDPRPLYFWINGARIIAYDMPYWRFGQLGGEAAVPATVRQRISEEQAWAGLALVDRARQTYPREPLLLIEAANIHLNRRGDVATAAEYYRLAARQPNAPFYAARIYAELLKRMGRTREAYDWLCEIYSGLPTALPEANTDLVLQRIRELEQRLGIPPERAFQPPMFLPAHNHLGTLPAHPQQ